MPSSYSLDDLKKRLQDSSYKLTHQRKVVLEVFVDNPGCHLSAEEVHDILKQKSADIGLATVYRSLELLSAKDIDILQKIEFGDGCSRYELNVTEPNTHQHHHLICTKCKKVMEFSEDMLDTLEADKGVPASAKILVPRAALDAYKADSHWSSAADRILVMEDFDIVRKDGTVTVTPKAV